MPVASVPDTTLPMEIRYTQKLKKPKAAQKKLYKKKYLKWFYFCPSGKI